MDLDIFRIDNDFAITNWYKKPTFSGRYLNFFSHHPIAHKIGIIYSIVDKCINLANPKFHNNNLKEAKNILINNDYPLNFINKYMNIRLNTLKTKKSNNQSVVTIKHTILRNKKVILPFSNTYQKVSIMILNKITFYPSIK